jgi:RNA polymerase primary sigma factor
LSKREQKVLEMRYGLTGTGKRYTLKKVGQAIGVTPERVRRIQNEALAKLRRHQAVRRGE